MGESDTEEGNTERRGHYGVFGIMVLRIRLD